MKRNEFNHTLLKERLTVLKFLKTNDKKVVGEIKYIENLLMVEKTTEERKGKDYERQDLHDWTN